MQPGRPDHPRQSWAQEAFNFSNRQNNAARHSRFGSAKNPRRSRQTGRTAAPEAAKLGPRPHRKTASRASRCLPSEPAILERLQSRRQAARGIARAKSIFARSLLKAPEKPSKLGSRIEGGRIADLYCWRADRKSRSRCARLQRAIITMYEAMKPEGRAKVFSTGSKCRSDRNRLGRSRRGKNVRIILGHDVGVKLPRAA